MTCIHFFQFFPRDTLFDVDDYSISYEDDYQDFQYQARMITSSVGRWIIQVYVETMMDTKVYVESRTDTTSVRRNKDGYYKCT